MQNQPRKSGFVENVNDDHPYTPYQEQTFTPLRDQAYTPLRAHPPHPPAYQQSAYQQWNTPPSPPSPVTNLDEISSPTRQISHKERSMSPELLSPGLESIWSAETEKEVVANDASQRGTSPIHPAIEPLPLDPLAARTSGRIYGSRKKSFWWMLAAVVLMVIALAVGLGAGLAVKHHSSGSSLAVGNDLGSSPSSTAVPSPTASSSATSQYSIGGALDPAFYSTRGAFNGSGIALASQSFDSNDRGSLVLYFQHYTGQIRFIQLSSITGEWGGGDESTIVATNAKNGTPISAVSYSLQGSSTWHIFYLDKENHVRQRSNSNTTNLWTNGQINDLDLVAFNSTSVGMQACWYGNDYGDADYVHSPLPSNGDTSNASVTAHKEYGMHIWYPTNETTFQQLGWREGDVNWTMQDTWYDKNAHAGVGCYSWDPNSTVTYVMMVNVQEEVEFWWKDTNSSLVTDSVRHPINHWIKAPISIPGVHPSTSLGYTNYFYAQMNATDRIMGYNISWHAEATTITDNFTIPNVPGLPGTHLSVSTLPNRSGGDSLVVFYQTTGDDVSQFNRDLVGGQWTTPELNITALSEGD